MFPAPAGMNRVLDLALTQPAGAAGPDRPILAPARGWFVVVVSACAAMLDAACLLVESQFLLRYGPNTLFVALLDKAETREKRGVQDPLPALGAAPVYGR